MSVVYEPKGMAWEYAALAANLYRGCSHACRFCYAVAQERHKRGGLPHRCTAAARHHRAVRAGLPEASRGVMHEAGPIVIHDRYVPACGARASPHPSGPAASQRTPPAVTGLHQERPAGDGE